MEKISIETNKLNFEALLLKPNQPLREVIFAAGSGGNPESHLPLLQSIFECGCTVIAPYFERLVSPRPNLDELQLRVAILHGALNAIGESNLPIIGIGHSIGATLLLALAGGQMWMHIR